MNLLDCPYCRMTVVVKEDGICPSCRTQVATAKSIVPAAPANVFAERASVAEEPLFTAEGTFNPYQSPLSGSHHPTAGVSAGGKLSFLAVLFSFTGRIPRRTYWLASIVNAVGFFLVFALATIVFGEDSDITLAIVFLSYVPVLWISFAVNAKRYHDHNKSGWWNLIVFIPYIGALWQFIELGCMRGTVGRNRYGADPS